MLKEISVGNSEVDTWSAEQPVDKGVLTAEDIPLMTEGQSGA